MFIKPWWEQKGRALAPLLDRAAGSAAILFVLSLIKTFFLITKIAEDELKEASPFNQLYRERWMTMALLVAKNPGKMVDPAQAAEFVESSTDLGVIRELEDAVGTTKTCLSQTRIVRFDQHYRQGRNLMEPFLGRVRRERDQGIADPEELRVLRAFERIEEEEAQRVANQDRKIDVTTAEKDKQIDKANQRADKAERELARLRYLQSGVADPDEVAYLTDPNDSRKNGDR